MARSASDFDLAAVSPATAAAVAGAVGAGALHTSPLERLVFNYFTRKGSPYRPYADTPLGIGLHNGSGEPMMTNRWQNLLKRYGINTTYAPSRAWDWVDGYKESLGDMLKGSKPGDDILSVLKRSPAWGNSVVYNGRTIGGLEDILKKFTPKEYKKFLKYLKEGKYNDFSLGTLRDFALLDKNFVLSPDRIAAAGTVDKLSRQGKVKSFFNAFRGFTTNVWAPGDNLEHIENWNNTHGHRGAVNLGRASDFQANYNAGSKHFIPGTAVYNNPLNRNGLTARLAHMRDRDRVIKKIHSINKDIDLNGKKIIFMDSGSAGPNNIQKIKDLVAAVKDRKDVHILFQHGKDSFAKGLLGPSGVLSQLSAKHPGLITAIDRLHPTEMGTMINGSNLHLTYGGSSSAGEAGSHLTPSIFTRDGALNDQNLQFVRRKRNSFGGIPIRKIDTSHTAIASALDEFKRVHGRYPTTNAELNKVLQDLSRAHLAAPQTARRIALRMMKDPTYIEKIRGRNNRIINEMLSDKIQNARYSGGNIRSAKTYIDSVRASDKHLVNTTKEVIKNLIQKDDTTRVRRLGANLKAIFSGKSGKMRGSALKRVLSLKGLRDANLAAGGFFTKNPIGRRAALPILSLAGLAGAGKYLYDKSKKDT